MSIRGSDSSNINGTTGRRVQIFNPLAAGGTQVVYNDYIYYVFTATSTFIALQGISSVDVFIVAAGGGAQSASIGGGGGGIVVWESTTIGLNSSYTVTVGTGVSAGTGNSSTFNGITAVGGQYGAAFQPATGDSGYPTTAGATTRYSGGNDAGQANGGGASYAANGSNAIATYQGGAGANGYTTDARLRDVLGGSSVITNVLSSGGGGGIDTRAGATTFGAGGTGAGTGTTASYGAASSYGSGAGGSGWTGTSGPGMSGLVVIRAAV